MAIRKKAASGMGAKVSSYALIMSVYMQRSSGGGSGVGWRIIVIIARDR